MKRVNYHESLPSTEVVQAYEDSIEEVRKLVSVMLSMVPGKDAMFMTWGATEPEGVDVSDGEFVFTGSGFLGTNMKVLGFLDNLLDVIEKIDPSKALTFAAVIVAMRRFDDDVDKLELLIKEAMQNVN